MIIQGYKSLPTATLKQKSIDDLYDNLIQEADERIFDDKIFRNKEKFRCYFEALAYFYENDETNAKLAINSFQDLRGGGVTTHISMIFTLLFHKYFFSQIKNDKNYLDDS